MITYADIKRIYRLEQKDASLQEVGPEFYSEVGELLKSEEKHKEAFVKLIDDIYNYREQKIVLGAIRAQRADIGAPENLTPEEKEMYDEVVGLLKKYRKKLFGGEKGQAMEEKGEVMGEEGEVMGEEEEVMGEEMVGEEEEVMGEEMVEEKIKIRLIQALPAIIGSDLQHYGPFSKGDIVEIPVENAKILIHHGIAEGV